MKKIKDNNLSFYEDKFTGRPGHYIFPFFLKLKGKKGIRVFIQINIKELEKGLVPLSIVENKLRATVLSLTDVFQHHKKDVKKLLK